MTAQIAGTQNQAKNMQKAEKYAKLSLHYSLNAAKFLKLKEYEKACEMMWGAMATILKAIAARDGIHIKKHNDLWGFAEKTAKKTNDTEIYTSFSLASNLHTNFYESELDEKTLRKIINRIAKTIGKLMKDLGYRPL